MKRSLCKLKAKNCKNIESAGNLNFVYKNVYKLMIKLNIKTAQRNINTCLLFEF